MGSVNKVILLGNVGNQPELRYTQSNQAVTELRIATNDSWTDKDGNRQERTEWHSVVVWGRQAENCERFLSKGRPVFIEGRLQTREYTDKEGQKRYKTEIVASGVTFLGGRGEGSGPGDAGPQDGEGGGGVRSGGGGGGGGRDGSGGGRDGGGGGAARGGGRAGGGGGGRDSGGGGGGGGGWGSAPPMDGGNVDDDIPW